MTRDACNWLLVAVLLSGCPADGDDETGGDTTTAASATMTAGDDGTTQGTTATTTATTADDATTTSSEETDHGHDETDHGHDETHGHDESTTTGSHGDTATGQSTCEIIGEGCHDNETPEGVECHLLGHDGDEAACEKAYEMCAEICGL